MIKAVYFHIALTFVLKKTFVDQKPLKGRSHMRPRMDFHLVLHGEYL